MDQAERAGLLTLINLPAYQTLLEIFDAQVVTLERAVFEIDPADEVRVMAAHKVAVGARWAFEEMKKYIERETNIALEENKPKQLTRKEEDELYIKSLQH